VLIEFEKARISAAICSLGVVMWLLAASPEITLAESMIVKAVGAGLIVLGFFLMASYLIEGVLAMRKVLVEVKKNQERRKR